MKKFLFLAIVVVSPGFSANFYNHHVGNSAVTNAAAIIDIFNGSLWVLSDPSIDTTGGGFSSNSSGNAAPLATTLTFNDPYNNPHNITPPWGLQQYITFPRLTNSAILKYNIYVKLPKSPGPVLVDRVTINTSPSQTTAITTNNGTATLTPFQGNNKLLSFLYTPNPSVIPTPTSYASGTLFRGINLPGGEFGTPVLPSYTDAVYYIYRGMNVVRIPFSWESIQPNLGTPIDFSVVGSNAYNLAQFVSNLQAASPGMHIILDMHNYMRYPSNSGLPIGAGGPTTVQYALAWGQIATQFKTFPNVQFDLMNEPHDMDTTLILTNYNAAIAAIRTAGATNLLLLEGNQYSCLGTWGLPNGSEAANSTVFVLGGIIDPGNNYAINAHEYFSGNNGEVACGSGESPNCVMAANVRTIEHFDFFTSYLQTNNFKAFLTETNAAPNTNCVNCIKNFLTLVEENALSVHGTWGFIGWTAWSSLNIVLTNVLNLAVNPDGTDRLQWTGAYDNFLTPPTWTPPP